MNYNFSFKLFFISIVISLIGISIPIMAKTEISGEIGVEARFFKEPPIDSRQQGDNLSFYFKPEFFWKSKEKPWTVTFSPFIRVDESDSKRTHGDIRELVFHHAGKKWEYKLGITKVYWGVTESQHLVDIINQTDAIESIDGEEKLGQPMLNLIFKQNWGTTELFLLPYFRKRTFTGVQGRLRPSPPIDASQTRYESSAEENNLDFAIRWSRTIGIWDIGLSHFSGTSRIPRFTFGADINGQAVLLPYYDQIDQTGLDLQATAGSWLWKLEVISRNSQFESYNALTAGFEYTKTGIFKSKKDLGYLVEFLYDDRNDPRVTPFERDVFLGLRLAFNDVQSTEVLTGVIIDDDSDERSYFLELSRRMGKSFKLSVEARITSNPEATSLLYPLRRDNHIQLQLIRYF